MLHNPALVNTVLAPLAAGHSAAGRPLTLGMISNPRSGGNKRGFAKISAFLMENPQILHHEAITPLEVEHALMALADHNIDLLIINGGDGTVQAVLTVLYTRKIFHQPPILALLRAGTTSMLARDVGIDTGSLVALTRILDWARQGEMIPEVLEERPILKIDRGENQPPLCGMFFGAGAIPRGIDLFHQRVNPRGIRGELMPGLILIRLLLAVFSGNENVLPATGMQIGLDGGSSQQHRCLFTLVSTLERLFLGLRPFWGNEDAPLHLTTLETRPRQLLRNLPAVLRGHRSRGNIPQNGYISHNAQRVDCSFKGRFTLDGELFDSPGSLSITAVGPARFLKI